MNYQEARQYIEKVAQTGIILGLDSIKNLLNELGNPQDDLKFIHIAGTNGKGSVLAYVSTMMEIAGYKTGRYISPTVESYRERIQVNRELILKTDFSRQLAKIKKAIERMSEAQLPHPSVFEIETALGFLHFKDRACDVVVMETGMGGASDATNVIQNTLVSVFTSISRDHMEFLGDTIADLTYAKVGIIKEGCHIVHGQLNEESTRIIKYASEKFKNKIHIVSENDIIIQKKDSKYTQKFSYKDLAHLTIHLLGKHQIENACLAIEAVRALKNQGFYVSDESIKKGLAKTRWFARVTVVKEQSPVIVIDGAHNQDAVRALAKTLIELFPTENIIGIMGVFKDKEIQEMINEIKPVIKKIHAISLPNEKRTLSAKELKRLVIESGITADSHDTLENALNTAMNEAGESGVIVAFGSLSYLGEVAKYI